MLSINFDRVSPSCRPTISCKSLISCSKLLTRASRIVSAKPSNFLKPSRFSSRNFCICVTKLESPSPAIECLIESNRSKTSFCSGGIEVCSLSETTIRKTIAENSPSKLVTNAIVIPSSNFSILSFRLSNEKSNGCKARKIPQNVPRIPKLVIKPGEAWRSFSYRKPAINNPARIAATTTTSPSSTPKFGHSLIHKSAL